MQVKRVTDVHNNEILSECFRRPEGGAPIRWADFAILQQKIAILTPF